MALSGPYNTRLVCSVQVVTIITGLNISNKSLLKNWYIQDLICTINVVTMIKKKFTSQMSSPQKVAFSGSSMLHTCGNRYNWVKL